MSWSSESFQFNIFGTSRGTNVHERFILPVQFKQEKNLFGVIVFLVNYPFKGVVHSTMKMCLKCTHPKACQQVHNFIFLLEQIWRNLALHHLLTNGCFAVNGCRQNESPQLKKTSQ